MVFAADTLRDTLASNWALTGRLIAQGSEPSGMQEPVFFFAFPQIAGSEITKAVEVIAR